MLKPWLLRLHRWTTLVFSLPLAIVILTGLVLSFEPIVQTTALKPGAVTVASVQDILQRHDPEGKARALAFRAYDGVVTIGGAGAPIEVDAASGQRVEGSGTLANLFRLSRRWHETLMLDGSWLVVASTYAMLALIMLGVLMGLPRIRNTVAGWHKATAWFLLPLLILSPLTGLFLAYNITFADAPARSGGRPAPVPLAEAVRMLGERHDLSSLVWLRPRGGPLLARVNDGGEFRVYAVTREGLRETGRNWPRLIHEGNFAGVWSGLLNVVTSIALVLLLGTGLFMWARRKLRRRPARVPMATAAGAASA